MSSMPREESILKYILANPGCHLRQVKNAFQLGMGQAEWYLNKLERKGQVWSEQERLGLRRRRFYAKEKIRLWGP